MRYKCCDCGQIFDEEDAGTINESRGEFWGEPCYESMMCCPSCNSMDIDECDKYDECYYTEDYDIGECESCPYKDECSGYDGGEEEEEPITEMYESGYISDKERFKDGND